ncbi:MurR/RpiR family transcriptional regulator [Candidatus Pseudothioglobus singularis]|jgi:DNA-binding MurR/RpiR family transcriptional regulator|nr:MurR/RpiR family transcriptional regulator [Candidatus Pseudothioglobus singularis]
MTTEYQQSFESLINSFEGKLTDADQELIHIILGEPSEAVYLSSAELASKAAVHASTVVRLARKLGFDGFPDMRQKLRQDVEFKKNSSDKIRQRIDLIEKGSNLSDLIESEIAAIAAISNTVSQNQIDEVVNKIYKAKSIFIVGRGSAAPLMTHFERRLRRSGIQCRVALNLQRRDLAEQLIGIQKGDAIVVFGFQSINSLPSGYSSLIESAKSIGAHSIAIGDSTILTARPKPDIVLSVSRPKEGVMQLRSGPMLICEALAMTLLHKKSKKAVRGVESLEHLRANFLETDNNK